MKRRNRIVPAYKQNRINRMLDKLVAQHAQIDRLIEQAAHRLQRHSPALTDPDAAPAAAPPATGTR